MSRGESDPQAADYEIDGAVSPRTPT